MVLIIPIKYFFYINYYIINEFLKFKNSLNFCQFRNYMLIFRDIMIFVYFCLAFVVGVYLNVPNLNTHISLSKSLICLNGMTTIGEAILIAISAF